MPVAGKYMFIFMFIMVMLFCANGSLYIKAPKPKDGKKYFDCKYNLILHILTSVAVVVTLMIYFIKHIL